MDIINSDLKYIKRRLKLLDETAGELKNEFKRTKNPLLQDLYLEIQCYSGEIEGKIKKIEKEVKWVKKKKKT